MTIDFSFLSEFSNPFAITWFLFTHGGWLIIIVALFWGGFKLWTGYAQERFASTIEYVILAIDVPRETEQTPKALESAFAHIHGVESAPSWYEKNIKGEFQPPLSFEIISIGGFIQYLVRIPIQYRDLVESAFYAQYPDAEISEVEDYTQQFVAQFPNEEYDLWGADIVLRQKDYYPIRTYPAFEHTMTQQLLDPMASLLEYMSRLRPGEQLWIQTMIVPPDDDSWLDGARGIIKKLAKATYGSSGGGGGLLDNVLWLPKQVASGLTETFTADLVSPFGKEESSDSKEASIMSHLTPNDKAVIEAISYKTAKLYFDCKMRIVYLGEGDSFSKDRVPGITGALKQFNTLDMNGFKVDKKTKPKAKYLGKEKRIATKKKRILRAFQNRDMSTGADPYVLNIEELATIYHFPVVNVKAPLVQKTEARRAEPPSSLPVEVVPIRRAKQVQSVPVDPDQEVLSSDAEEKDQPPSNLPI
ncbi:MAG: hypothetical protein H6760_02675 [Candidatus Nomurabacteria bacterium]|nr:MAG: hypothetical protein H6760_02675 [Candidatus Nomurabacteria bacterium]